VQQSHTQRLIFVKTKKVAGTSFEIALSGLCGPDCTITPISPVDEEMRRQLGCRGAQNYQTPVWQLGAGRGEFRSPATFYNHMPAPDIQAAVPAELWESYRKVTLVRNPYDVAISMYFWQDHVSNLAAQGVDFGQFVAALGDGLNFNDQIAPLEGPARMDHYLRYENLHDDIDSLGIKGLADVLDVLKSKADIRPKTGTSMQDMYQRHPEAAATVARACRAQIDAFGYAHPLQSAA